MLTALLIIGSVVLLGLTVPALILIAQVLSACLSRPFPAPGVERISDRGGITATVLMPAHNEAAGIGVALEALTPQLRSGDKLLVVADNCEDETAKVARAHGADVIERHDPTRRGKGYALDFGVRSLEQAPPDIVVILDADCAVQPGALDRLVAMAAASGRPVQALYLMRVPAGGALNVRVAAFAWKVKNLVRPLGWHRLGLPCQLMGTGMAFPWPLLQTSALASGHLVEDMVLGANLAERGHPPLFCPEAEVFSSFPVSDAALEKQRTRWEHGHLSTLLSHGPRLFKAALRARSLPLAALAFDLGVPPIASLVLLLLLVCSAGGLLAFAGMDQLFWAATAVLTSTVAATVLAWHRFARDVMSAADWCAIPAYVAGKLPLYWRFVRGKRQRAWLRTDREHEQRNR